MRLWSKCATAIGSEKGLGEPLSDQRLLSSALASRGVTRRHFLRVLLSTPIAATLDVEKLLWIPGQTMVVPASRSIGDIVAETWEKRIRDENLLLFFSREIYHLNPGKLGVITNIEWDEHGNKRP